MSSSEFITPDPDYVDEDDEGMGVESVDSFEFEESLELSAAPRSLQACSLVIFTLLCLALHLMGAEYACF